MQRVVPGSIVVEGRAFLYFQMPSYMEFKTIFRKIGQWVNAAGEVPKTGGMVSENVEVEAPDRRRFYGLSFKGDRERWERAILRFAEEHRVPVARVSNDRIYTSDSEFLLSQCRVTFFQK